MRDTGNAMDERDKPGIKFVPLLGALFVALVVAGAPRRSLGLDADAGD